MYFLLEKVDFQPAMLVYWRVFPVEHGGIFQPAPTPVLPIAPPGEEFQDKGTNGTMSSSKLGTFFRDSQVRNIVTQSQYERCFF